MKLLFITANRVGDAILSTGLLGHLLDRHPGLLVTLACGAAPASLFQSVPGLERLIVLRKRKLAGHWVGLWRQVVGQRWDIVVDLRGSALAWGLWAGRRVVWSKPGQQDHRVVQLSRLLDLPEPAAPRLWSDPQAQARAAALIPDRPVLALGPTANWVGKQWPVARFGALAERLTGAGGVLAGAPVALFGAPNERVQAAPLFAALGERAIDGFGLGDLATVGAALGRCRLYVGNDSGLMHLAAAAGTPTLGLFGPSPPHIYGPWGRQTAIARTLRPYPDHFALLKQDPGQLPHLMDDLPVETALAAALPLLTGDV